MLRGLRCWASPFLHDNQLLGVVQKNPAQADVSMSNDACLVPKDSHALTLCTLPWHARFTSNTLLPPIERQDNLMGVSES
jgi:hypothetical protein